MRALSLVLAASVACSDPAEETDVGVPTPTGPTEPFVELREVATSGGAFLVTYAPTPDPIPLNDYFSLDVAVMRNDGTNTLDPEVTVVVDAGMPTHGHGMNVVPTLSPSGDGTFLADGLLFHMEGEWAITVDVTGPEGVEAATFGVMCCD